MKIGRTSIFAIINVVVFISGDLHAEQQVNDRIALTLSGSECPAQRERIAQRLSQIPGVKRVDMDLVEGHVLIDHVRGPLTVDDFKAIVNEVIPPGSQCRAEFIEGCISVGPMVSAPSQ
ncbi:MAG: hypothetical protein NNA23_02900 [Nitrospira sp.]|nr:hypothetical protein [Nitrospira sp.]MCP9463273.1 hypothetical protein [Nitrospira sp.]